MNLEKEELRQLLEKRTTELEQKKRELEIEAALEKVRSRSMAMQKADELQEVINTVYQQLKSLNIAITGGAFIAINEENTHEINCWGAGGTADYVDRVHIPYLDQPIYYGLINNINKGEGLQTEEYSYEEKIEFFNHLFKHPPYNSAPPEHKKKIISRKGGYTRSSFVSAYTSIFIINHHGRVFTKHENIILTRFGKVFEQAYVRFRDLKKAEEQAHEAQLEASLERVRAVAMSMQKPEDLMNICQIISEQLEVLGVSNIRNVQVGFSG